MYQTFKYNVTILYQNVSKNVSDICLETLLFVHPTSGILATFI